MMPRRLSARAWLLTCLLPMAAPAGVVYEAIRGESSITYRVKHPLHPAEAVSRDFRCRVELAQDTLSSKVTVDVDAKTFNSGIRYRDEHALIAIQADRNPRVLFASDSLRRTGEVYRIYGQLTFAGRTRPVDFAVTPWIEPGKVRIVGQFAIKLTDYGVTPPSLMSLPIEDRVDVRFDLIARDDWNPGAASHPWNPQKF